MYPVDERNMYLFWYWMSERQEIFHKRYILKQDPPWTEDTIFQTYKFTNVFRSLDRGTVFWKENIMDVWMRVFDGPEHAFKQILFDTLVYRHFNYIKTWQAIEQPVRLRRWDKVFSTLWNLDRVYTNAHNVTGVRWDDSDIKVENSMFLLKTWDRHLDAYTEALKNCKTMEEAFDYVKANIIGYGGFTSYELVCDLSYLPFTPYTEDEWANPGPGATRGLNRIWPGIGKNKAVLLDAMKYLRDHQDDFLKEFNLPFKEYPSRLTMRAIEHSLCEFSKYAKAYWDEGRPRNKYKGTEQGMEELKYA